MNRLIATPRGESPFAEVAHDADGIPVPVKDLFAWAKLVGFDGVPRTWHGVNVPDPHGAVPRRGSEHSAVDVCQRRHPGAMAWERPSAYPDPVAHTPHLHRPVLGSRGEFAFAEARERQNIVQGSALC